MARLLLFFAVILLSLPGCSEKTVNPEKEIAALLVGRVDSFMAECGLLEDAVVRDRDAATLQQLFLKARNAYKRFEWAAEYFEPATSRFVNGPPVPEVEPTGQQFQPAGLQVMEPLLFPGYDTASRSALLKELELLRPRSEKYEKHFANIDILRWQVLDAVKLEIFRKETTGIAGFDDPVTLKSMQESAEALTDLGHILDYYKTTKTANLAGRVDAAKQYLLAHQDFNTFDRAEFIRRYGNPLSSEIAALEDELQIRTIRYNRLLSQDARTLFDTGAFNVNAYSPSAASFATPKKIALGRRLFFDPVLSGNNIRSCASCHQPDKAFADGLVRNTVIEGDTVLRRNTPSLINAALQSAQFYDLRVSTLEDQSLDVVQNSLEMHGSLRVSVARLWQDSSYRRMFVEAFPSAGRTGIDTSEVMNALASYVRSLTLLNSRFDEYMRGDDRAMNGSEVRGFNLFMGKAKCGTCHYMPLFNGTFPPRYMKTEAEVIGVPATVAGKKIDDDRGRYDVVHVASLDHAFKTPSLRNAVLTAPYMHNGVYRTLEEVMDFYNKGGGAGLGLRVDNQTLPFEKLDLTDQEINDIIAFIHTLNSKLR